MTLRDSNKHPVAMRLAVDDFAHLRCQGRHLERLGHDCHSGAELAGSDGRRIGVTFHEEDLEVRTVLAGRVSDLPAIEASRQAPLGVPDQ